MKAHFEMMAAYNAWANGRLYDAAGALDDAAREADLGAFFGSVMGTLNHLVVADLIWLARLQGGPALPLTLDQRLHDDFGALRAARTDLDQRLAADVAAREPAAFATEVEYRNMAGEPFRQPLGQVLAHVFNHQTHHRGQIHAMLTRLTSEAPVLDLLYFQRSM